jgi:hypothetical protein
MINPRLRFRKKFKNLKEPRFNEPTGINELNNWSIANKYRTRFDFDVDMDNYAHQDDELDDKCMKPF